MFGSVVQIGTLIFEGLFGLLTAYTAYTLFAWTPPAITKARDAMRLPRWFWLLAGTVATIGAVCLLTGLVVPVVGALAAIWMIAYFVVATGVHVVRNSMGDIAPAIVFLVLAIGLTALRWSDLAPLFTHGL